MSEDFNVSSDRFPIEKYATFVTDMHTEEMQIILSAMRKDAMNGVRSGRFD
jgi:hypothetical protein